ncbi:MAG: Na+ dependent nucleoside transporter N-terminal domain-containing protein [Candidatus Euphemobacter frigidus]|nr:Na+ dependent nucleoside transporter N-terminal domain-containing protein [Candidatus Euphemobacter frigidus]MDP8275631.1 Na+ dependent nucleoside transporter N-terminal domain-containing protein [Candidatus Euphemobacter frigidus]
MGRLNLISLAGIAVLILIAFVCSNNKKKIRWRIVGIGLIAEVVFAFLILHTVPGEAFFDFISRAIIKVLDFAYTGIDFVFGWLYSGQGIKDFHTQHAFILEALVPIVFCGSIIGVLYHYGIMQKIVKWISVLFTKALGISSAESLATVSNVFLGQTQAPLVVAPYVKKMTQSEFFLLMVSGMATVAGSLFIAYNAMGAQMKYVLAASIMAAPGSIIMAKIMIPEIGTPETVGDM